MQVWVLTREDGEYSDRSTTVVGVFNCRKAAHARAAVDAVATYPELDGSAPPEWEHQKWQAENEYSLDVDHWRDTVLAHTGKLAPNYGDLHDFIVERFEVEQEG